MKNVILIGFKSGHQCGPFTGNYRDDSWLFIWFVSAEVIDEDVKRVWGAVSGTHRTRAMSACISRICMSASLRWRTQREGDA